MSTELHNQNIHKAATRDTFIRPRPAVLCSLQCSIHYTRANNDCTCVNMKSSCKNEAAFLGAHLRSLFFLPQHCFFLRADCDWKNFIKKTMLRQKKPIASESILKRKFCLPNQTPNPCLSGSTELQTEFCCPFY